MAKKQEEKRPKTSKKPEEWVKVPVKKDLHKKKKTKPEARKTERPKRFHPDAVLIKSS